MLYFLRVITKKHLFGVAQGTLVWMSVLFFIWGDSKITGLHSRIAILIPVSIIRLKWVSAAKHILPVPVLQKTKSTAVTLASSSEIWAIVYQGTIGQVWKMQLLGEVKKSLQEPEKYRVCGVTNQSFSTRALTKSGLSRPLWLEVFQHDETRLFQPRFYLL